MSNFLLIGLIVVVWLVVLAPLLLRSQKPIRKAGEAFDDTRVILEGGSSVPMRRRPRLGGDTGEEDDSATDREDEEYELEDSPSIFRHRREDVREDEDQDDWDDRDDRNDDDRAVDDDTHTGAGSTALSTVIAEADTANAVTADAAEPVAEVDTDEDTTDSPDVEVIAEWNAEDHYALDDSYTAPIDLMHHEERVRAIADYRATRAAGDPVEDTDDETTGEPVGSRGPEDEAGELTQADMEFAARRRGRGYYDPQADREFAHNQHIRRQRTLLGLGVAVVVTLILGFVLGGGVWALPAIAVAMTALYLVALRRQVRAENELRARRIRHLRRSRMGVRSSGELPPRLRRPGAVVLELDDESPDFEGLDTTYLPVEDHDDGYRTGRTRRVS